MFNQLISLKKPLSWVFSLIILTSTAAHGADVSFRWAILADKGKGMQPLDFSGTPIVHSGTALQIYIEHESNCHIYMFLLDSSNELTPLYPAEPGYYNYGFTRGPRFIPPGDQSFSFVPPAGMETIYLIASEERLFQVERLTQEFTEHSNYMGQQKLLLSEIETFIRDIEKKSRSREGREKVTKKTRTAEGIKKSEFIATEVDASDAYGRKLLIDHR